MSEKNSRQWYKKWWVIVIGILLIIVYFNSTSQEQVKKPIKDQANSDNNTTDDSFPYNFVDSKTEENMNKLDLYAYSGDLDVENLKQFCKENKQKFNTGTFYYLFLFDNKSSASFPKDPFTALYGTEEDPKKHIKAYCEFNRLNGYSKITHYEKNMWESIANEENF